MSETRFSQKPKFVVFLVAKQLYEPLMSFCLSVCLSPFFGKIECFKGALKLPQGLIKVDSRVS